MLCGGFYGGSSDELELSATCIAAEVNAVVCTGCTETALVEWIPATVKGCLDLVAARGIRGGRGRCACHCECETATERWLVPVLPEEGGSWEIAEPLLLEHKVLDNETMRDDSHTPPLDWDFAVRGAWRCKRQGCDATFISWADWRARVKAFFKLKGDKSTDGKKATTKRAKAYAKVHPSGQAEHMPPLTMLAMICIIIDPLHCLMLNLPKVIWKYSFGDRMTNDQRELVAQ